ncbi:MAG: hypothetical protein OEQ53_00965 [Saprospiraceae bacterium]|nr:hypothetical protein [Saprospiraceae bacterium]
MKIEALHLYSRDLGQMQEFYVDELGMTQGDSGEDHFSLQCGDSVLHFWQRDDAKPYHFAFNIPSNLIKEALIWMEDRVPPIRFEGRSIIDFPAWNAQALYFYDPDFNIVEFIARQDVEKESSAYFDARQVISISEIGMVTDDIEALYVALNEIKPLPIYDGTFTSFCAMGDPQGLFIVVNFLRKKWFPSGDEMYRTDFVIEGDFNVEYKGGKIRSLEV